MKDQPANVVLAAGAVLWRQAGDDIEIAVIHRPKYDDWSLPKGKLDLGEHVLVAARREVREETGATAILGRPLGSTSYLSLGLPKRVRYWAAEAVAGEFEPNTEVDDLRWLVPDKARERLEREADRVVLDQFTRGPARTVAVVVLRHAKAQPRKSWHDDDELRPLAPAGERQSERLAPLLAGWDVRHVTTSPARRCVQTLEPFRPPSTFDNVRELTEESHEQSPEAAQQRFRDVLAGGEAAVVCSHRPVLPGLIEVVRGASPLSFDLDLDQRPLRTAEMLVAHVSSDTVVSAERHRA